MTKERLHELAADHSVALALPNRHGSSSLYARVPSRSIRVKLAWQVFGYQRVAAGRQDSNFFFCSCATTGGVGSPCSGPGLTIAERRRSRAWNYWRKEISGFTGLS